jgi:UDP-glucose 4,6-dehydratase
MKNILVTGGCGFIASNFLNFVVVNFPQYNFVNLDCLNYCSSTKNVESISNLPNYTFVHGNIQNQDLVTNILNSHSIDTIIHFAAQSHVDLSFENSLQYSFDNVIGTHVLLECSRLYGKLEKFIHISTDEVYGESHLEDTEPKKESTVMCPTNPYAATKAGAELIARSYFHSYNLPVIITRGNNVYGPRQYPDKVIPKFIKLLASGQKMTIHGTGLNTRAFIHVSDVIQAVLTVLFYGTVGEIYNIGSSDELSVLDLSEKLISYFYPNEDFKNYITFVQDRPFNDTRYFVCDAKLQNLGWSKKVEFNDGVHDTIQWYMNNLNYFD